jgi:hypothetical protein
MKVARDAGGVLIVRPSSLGDIVYALAVVSDIRRERPALAVDWVAEQGFMPLIAMCPDVRRCDSIRAARLAQVSVRGVDVARDSHVRGRTAAPRAMTRSSTCRNR